MKSNRKIYKVLKWLILLLPLWLLIYQFLGVLIGTIGMEITENAKITIYDIFDIYNIEQMIKNTYATVPFNLNQLIVAPIRNFLDWINYNLFLGNSLNSGSVYGAIWYYVGWFIQCKLAFLLIEALLFFIDFAERLLNKTYRKE